VGRSQRSLVCRLRHSVAWSSGLTLFRPPKRSLVPELSTRSSIRRRTATQNCFQTCSSPRSNRHLKRWNMCPRPQRIRSRPGLLVESVSMDTVDAGLFFRKTAESLKNFRFTRVPQLLPRPSS
jgi:hypothetical protein